MKKSLKILIPVILVAAAAFFFYSSTSENGGGDSLVLYGNVDIREVDLGFRISGKIEAMLFEEGDKILKSQVLARLDKAPYQQEVEAAQARVASIEANLAKLQNGPRPQEIAGAKARLEETQASYNNALREYKRQSELLQDSAASRKTYDEAKTEYELANARVAQAQQQLDLLQEGSRAEDISAAEAELQEAQARLALSEIHLSDCQLKAPNDGTILTRIREPGSIVNSGTSVYILSLDTPVYIRAYVKEPSLGKITPGQKVQITTDSSSTPYTGQIGYISPRAEFTPKNVETADLRTDLVYRLRIIVDGETKGLRQGMPVTITFKQH